MRRIMALALAWLAGHGGNGGGCGDDGVELGAVGNWHDRFLSAHPLDSIASTDDMIHYARSIWTAKSAGSGRVDHRTGHQLLNDFFTEVDQVLVQAKLK